MATRVLTLVPLILQLSIGKTKCLPPKVFTESYPRVKYPPSVSKKVEGASRHSDFGLDMECALVQKLAVLYGDHFMTNHSDPSHRAFEYLSPKDQKTWTKIIDREVSETAELIHQTYPPKKITQIVHTPTFGIEGSEGIEGHPDLVIYTKKGEVIILDVKVFHFSTGKSKAARGIRAQIGMYAALARANGLVVNKIGIVMPWGRLDKLTEYDITKWDSSELITLALEALEKTRAGADISYRWQIIYANTKYIGHHQRKTSFSKLLELDPLKSRPFQVFLLGNLGSNGESVGLESLAGKYEGAFTHYRAYVHAPYSLSLSREKVTTKYEDAPTIAEASVCYMKTSRKMGFRGVVFHVDKSPETEKAYENIRDNVRAILPEVSTECPLYLETPCGDGKGFLSTPQMLVDLVREFPPEKIGICLDTCHVHGAGYDPMEYVTQMGMAHHRIGLIHLNGAWKKKGCKADGHCYWGEVQNISEVELTGVLTYAKKRGLDCIIE